MPFSKTFICILFFGFCLWQTSLGNDTSAVQLLVDTLADQTEMDVDQIVLAADEDDMGSGFWQKLFSNQYLGIFAFVFLVLLVIYMPVRSVSLSTDRILDRVNNQSGNLGNGELFDLEEKGSTYRAAKRLLKLLMPASVFGYLLYVSVVDTGMEGYIKEWLNLLIRWAHVVAGIMWIGASFYFIFLENNLNRTKNIRDELAGNLWAVHGGGFYFLEKYKVAPQKIPEDLHWFKYEAYFTFVTGFLLLIVVYYMNAKGFLIDPSVLDMSTAMAIGISLLSIVSGWIVYDILCKSKIIQNDVLFVAIGFIFLAGLAYFLSHVFNPRAAYIHFGAIIGAIMVGNVYFNIIPAQKAMVRAAMAGEPLDASLGKKAGQRSLHNNYFTLPVIFIMISNHFPSTYGHPSNWLILLAICVISAAIKHYWNLLERGEVQTKLLAASLIALVALIYFISPAFEEKMDLAIPVTFEEANEVIQTRCVTCHSANPTDDEWTKAPNGVAYDTPDEIKFKADKIMTRAVRSKNMPLGNKTKMTEEERTILKRWIMQGANIEKRE